MNAVDRAAIAHRVGVFDELVDLVDDRTLQVLDRRRQTAKIRRRGWLVRRTLACADIIGLVLAFALAQIFFGDRTPTRDQVGLSLEIALFMTTIPLWLVVAKIYGLYDRDEERTDHTTAEDIVSVFHLMTVGAWGLFAFISLADVANPTKLFAFWAFGILTVSIGRTVARTYARRQIEYIQNTIIVGAGDVGQLIARKYLQHPEYGINLVGFVDSTPRERRSDLGHLTILGSLDELPKLIEMFDVERVVIAFSNEPEPSTLELIRELKRLTVQIDIVPRLFEIVGPSVDIHSVEGTPLIGLRPLRLSPSSRLLKRTLDIFVSLAVLTITAPLFALIAWQIKRDSAGPVFFRQARIGERMRTFTALKFRTMHVGTSSEAHEAYIRESLANGSTQSNGLFKLERSEVTRVGRWLRKTSLDELPQLINVLRGDMSLVGPRPCIPYEVEHFDPHHFDRFEVPAGLTGLWQVTARAHGSFREALDLDVAYARSWSFGLDIRLLLRTPLQVLRPSGTR